MPTSYNFQSEANRIKLNQAQADLLQQQALQPLQLPQRGGHLSWVNVLAKVLEARRGRQAAAQVRKDEAALEKRYGEELQRGMQQFYNTSQGGVDPATGQQIPGDSRKAIFDAMASQHPVLQQFAMKQLETLGKGQLTAKELAKYAVPSDVVANPGDSSKWRGKANLGQVGDTVYDKDAQKVVALGGPRPEFVTVNGDLMQVSPSTGSMREVNSAPRISQTVNMPSGEKAFERVLGEKEAGRLSEALEAQPGQVEAIEALTNAQGLLTQDGGIYSGILSKVALNATKAGAAFGLNDSAKAARTEKFMAHVNTTVVPLLKDFGGSDTKEEREFLERLQGSNTMLELDTIQSVVNSALTKMQRRAERTNAMVEAYKGRGKTLPTLEVPGALRTPATPATTPPGLPPGFQLPPGSRIISVEE